MKSQELCRKCLAVRLAALVLWAGGILWLSLIPNPPHPPGLLSWDKLQHAGAYGLLTILAGRLFALFSDTGRRGWLWAVFFAVSFGALVELVQGAFSPIRQADPGDLLANACGAVAVFAVARLWYSMTGRE